MQKYGALKQKMSEAAEAAIEARRVHAVHDVRCGDAACMHTILCDFRDYSTSVCAIAPACLPAVHHLQSDTKQLQHT